MLQLLAYETPYTDYRRKQWSHIHS